LGEHGFQQSHHQNDGFPNCPALFVLTHIRLFSMPIFRKHATEIRKVFADASPKELRALEATLKKIGKRAENLGTGINPKYSSHR
jgi:hypothetical protein